ncbi:MAG: hypothetical protein GY795_51135 [Desulfobacterales bacterium]|nr:hypothetical protein [Desulfobacterales bacterium]
MTGVHMIGNLASSIQDVRETGLGSASDPVIFDRASEENRIIVSADTDFGTLLAHRRQRLKNWHSKKIALRNKQWHTVTSL